MVLVYSPLLIMIQLQDPILFSFGAKRGILLFFYQIGEPEKS